MLKKEQIFELLEELNNELEKKGEFGEVGLLGGAVMCVVYNLRAATKDVDAIFEPAALIRKLVVKIAEEHNLPHDWLNDAAKSFLEGTFKRDEVVSWTNLRVWAPEPRYMLAMKCLSARWDTRDKEDVLFLLKRLKQKNKDEVFKIIESYYPKKRIPSKTQFFIEEILQK